MRRKKSATATDSIDPDDAPELTEEMLDRADFYIGDKLIKRGRGRPRVEKPKEQITLRLDADVISAIRKSGPGWTGRVNEVLSRSVKTGQFAKVAKRA
jgi:uncharacterized protein (DUF4415 family)